MNSVDISIRDAMNRATDAYAKGLISKDDHRDIISELEGNAIALRGVDTFLTEKGA